MRVSVCVPSYERPEMLSELIESFKCQDYADKELCISDDSYGEKERLAIRSIVAEVAATHRVVYHYNRENLGFAENLRQVLSLATGEIVLILGDDDLLARKDALARYVAAFREHPECDVAYSNLVSVDQHLHGALLYRKFDSDRSFEAGEDALVALLLKTVLITGIGLRNSALLASLYPDQVMLFPQVELVARLLMIRGGIGLSGFLCATRVHSDQLGFKALSGKRIKGGEQHGTVEILDIIERMCEHGEMSVRAARTLEGELVVGFASNTINERINGSVRIMLANVVRLGRRSRAARRYLPLWIIAVGSALLPGRLLLRVKEVVRYRMGVRQFRRAGLDIQWPIETVGSSRG